MFITILNQKYDIGISKINLWNKKLTFLPELIGLLYKLIELFLYNNKLINLPNIIIY